MNYKISNAIRTLRYFLCLIAILFSVQSYAQSGSDELIQLKSPLTVAQLINEISNQTNLNFAFDQSEIDVNQSISFPKNEMTVNEAIAIAAKTTGNAYTRIGKQIIIKPKKKELTNYTISGQIIDSKTGEDLIGVMIQDRRLGIGTVSNVYGFYSLTLAEGTHELTFSYVGYESQSISLDIRSNITQNTELTESGKLLGEVVVVADKDRDANVTSMEMGTVDVKIDAVKKMPALLGEADIIKTLQLLPGVASVGEGGSGFFVRGGGADQNLILLDEAPVYNASHLLGFFSSFNPDAIKDMKLYKAAIPAQYGGRLSSVLDIRMKEGNSKRLTLSGGIGTMMSRLAVESPLGEKGSFMIAGRRSYLDLVANAYNRARGESSGNGGELFFYDLNSKANYRFNDKNRIFLSGYFGRDIIVAELDDSPLHISWGNTTGTFRWNHLFSPKLFANLTYYYSNYDYFIDSDNIDLNFTWTSRLSEHSVKADFGAYLNPNNTLSFGIHMIRHDILPGNVEFTQLSGEVSSLDIQKNASIESAIYINNEQKLGSKLSVEYGLRLSSLHNLGSQEVFRLDQNYQITDTISHEKGAFNSYWNPEPRVGFRYQLNKFSSLKTSYNRTAQYIQLASNGNTSTPFDIWFPSSEQIKPQLADQFTLGYFRNFRNNSIELSAEVYYKNFQNSVDFKDHAQLFLNSNLEGELRIGEGRAYGLELMLRKNTGKLSGWVSYTLSKSEKKIESINNDQWYNAKFDKPHDLSIVASYELTPRLSFGGNFVYSTGGPVTFPTGRYTFQGQTIPIYSERNGSRLPDFHRLDLSISMQGKKNPNRRLQTEWILGIYNVYNRKNAFAINFVQEEINPNITYAEKQSVFSLVPSLTFNAKF